MCKRPTSLLIVTLIVGVFGGCYYSPHKRMPKADPSYLSEGDAESLIQKKMAPYGIKFVSNMKLQRGDILFEADGYDRDLRVGYEYRSQEGMDFEKDAEENGDGLSTEEIDALYARQKTYREYFLIVPEGTRDDVSQAINKFVKDLYAWEVLKKAKKKDNKENLFPDDDKDTQDQKDILPWESTKDLKKKREEMEAKEELEGKPGEEKTGSDDWGSDSSDDEWGTEEKDEGEEEEEDF
ncbi:MAG: hypothetical protein JRJ87_23035 [Deltaproteobacteria bacterium]|nr:hypothetical protein [Deltaproteobacteria bacterium]